MNKYKKMMKKHQKHIISASILDNLICLCIFLFVYLFCPVGDFFYEYIDLNPMSATYIWIGHLGGFYCEIYVVIL